MLDKILSEPGRKALYGVAAAVTALLVTLGVLAPDGAEQWLTLVQQALTLLATAVAIAHVGAPPAAGRHVASPDGE